MTFSKIMAYLIAFILGLVLIGAIMVGAAWYQLEVYRPQKNESNAATAHAWNDEYWENGQALRVTLTMEFSGPSGTIEVHETLLCTAKYLVVTGGLKNGPDAYIQAYTTGPSVMAVPIGDGVLLRADIRDACKIAFVKFDPEYAPHFKIVNLSLQIVSENPVLTCNLGGRTGTVSGSALRKAYISNIEAVPARTLMAKEDFEIIEASDRSNQGNGYSGWYGHKNSLSWKGCWSPPITGGCNTAAEQICGIPNL